MMFRIVFWDVLPYKMIVDNHFTQQYIPEENSEHILMSWSLIQGVQPYAQMIYCK
jgi:hypothetical protein